MILQFRAPPPSLSEFVSLLTYHRGYDPDHAVERLLPDGGINLIVDLTDRPKHIYDNHELTVLQTCTRSWISGARTELISISSGLDSRMLVISFPPWGASAFTDAPMKLLADRVLSAEDLWGASTNRLRERAGAAADIDRVFAAAVSWLEENFRMPGNGFDLVQRAARQIMDRPAMTSIDAVVDGAGSSHRHLIALFDRYVGITPKRLQRVRRFQQVVEQVHDDTRVDWAAVAVECGFYDQAHLIREFRAFSGLTPGRYMEVRGDTMNYLPVVS